MILTEIKVLSLWQPWASACVEQYIKTHETRSYPTKVRGPLLIHATKTITPDAREAHSESEMMRVYYPDLSGLPLGCIIGIVNLTGCCTTLEAIVKFERMFTKEVKERELAFGNYATGRFAWRFENPLKFDEPIKVGGSQGFWNYRVSLLPGVAKQYILNL